MALGTHPLFLESAIRPSVEELRKSGSKPVTSQLPYVVSVPFTMQPQAQSNWGWAATARAVSRYYSPLSAWEQCTIANAALLRSDCCTGASPVPPECNVLWTLDSALSVTGNFASVTGPISQEAVIAELRAGRPVAARQAWSSGNAQGVVICGYSLLMQVHRYTVADPYYGIDVHLVWAFENFYYANGVWTHSYYTKAP